MTVAFDPALCQLCGGLETPPCDWCLEKNASNQSGGSFEAH